MKKYFWSLLAFALVAMLSFSLSSCKNDDGIDEGATLIGQWFHEDESLYFTGEATHGNVTFTEDDDDDHHPYEDYSTFTFDPSTGILKMPRLTPFDVKVITLTNTRLKLRNYPDKDDDTEFRRK